VVKHQQVRLDSLYGALADPTRREMIARLRSGPLSISDLGAPFGMTLAAIGKHVAALESAGIVHTRKAGRVRRCALVPRGLSPAASWLAEQEQFWNERLDSLEQHLAPDTNLEENP
jgi:DNA-binding transcriptional ArsR family regulator